MSTSKHGWERRASELVEELKAAGMLTDPTWTEIFTHAPRHEFAARVTMNDGSKPTYDDLLEIAYEDRVLITRVADTANADNMIAIPTSSLSQPAIVAYMLELLDINDNDRVLEVGTGPGYNAYLLSERLGDNNVTSIDIDADTIDEARSALDRVGKHPYLAVRHGEDGCRERAPFDRVLVTCALDRIPPSWLDQIATGGKVIAPMTYAGMLALLEYRDGHLHGHFDNEGAYFLAMRDGETDESPRVAVEGLPHVTTINVEGEAFIEGAFTPWLELSVPGITVGRLLGDPGVQLTTETGKAELRWSTEGTTAVEYGETFIDKVETAWQEWVIHGQPDRSRLGMTVTPTRQWVWLDNPDSDVTWER